MLRFLNGMFESMSLERKCLLFYGSALSVLMLVTFWFVQIIAQRLVMGISAQAALDYADAMISRKHWSAINRQDLAVPEWEKNQEVLDRLDRHLLRLGDKDDAPEGDQYDYEILMLPNSSSYQNLPDAALPVDEREQALMEELQTDFRRLMAEKFAQLGSDLNAGVDLEENASFSQVNPVGRPRMYREAGPNGGRYAFYTPVFSRPVCLSICHVPGGGAASLASAEPPEARAALVPFRVVKVTTPQRAPQLATTWIRAVVIAMAMLIIFLTLVVLHAIVRFLILRPLLHLRDVSDAISRGNLALRAELDTQDEFQELGGAFNKMLGHLTDAHDRLQEMNRELDSRVDELARVNLQLYEANRLKSDFLANMSHELRTPLNSIIGFSDVLADVDSLTDRQRRYAQNIRKSGRVLLEMINDILDLAKLDAGKMEVRPTRFDIGSLVSAQCDMVRSLSEDKNISLTLNIQDNLPQVLQDQTKIGQILTNLLSNAIKFTPEGGLVTVSVKELPGEQFLLGVSDTGIGIAPDDHKVIFEKFRQGHSVASGDGMTRSYSGTGLGLSIVKELCELLGGRIRFTSELGIGSNFEVVLPLRLIVDPGGDRPRALLSENNPLTAR